VGFLEIKKALTDLVLFLNGAPDEIQFLRSRFRLELRNFGDSAFRPHHADSAGLGLPALLFRISSVGFLEIKKGPDGPCFISKWRIL
jgi:hypothetical protein